MDKRGILDFIAEQLQYISKNVLHEFENYVESLWDLLPEYLKANPEVQHAICVWNIIIVRSNKYI